MDAGAAIAVIIVWLLGLAGALAISVLILRSGLEPVRAQLQRIADEIEVRNDFDAGEGDSAET
jgi:divalent metal cation (Fe/Co/Zn/Cd) transporter